MPGRGLGLRYRLKGSPLGSRACRDFAQRQSKNFGEETCNDVAEGRLRGEIEMLRDPPRRAEGEQFFREALEIARARGAKWWELRATMSLARLLRDTDRRDEARAMLAEIYDWFTEGFDTVGLKDARALLDELHEDR